MPEPLAQDPAELVRRWTTARPVPGLPADLTLHQADDVITLWERTEQGSGTPGGPPFWAFAWAGGVGLAQHLLAHPEPIRGRSVIDVAAGSGLVAVVAARLGAARVEAVEVDPLAVAACEVNAAANAVAVTGRLADLLDGDGRCADGTPAEVVLAGDVFYEREFAARCAAFLHRAADRGAVVLVGDPGRAYVPADGMVEVGRYVVPVPTQLEDGTTKTVRILRPGRDRSGPARL